MKKKWVFAIVGTFLLIVTGCSQAIDSSENGEENFKNLLDDEKAIVDRLEELGEINLDWMAREGWVHYERLPSEEGIVKFTYQERWTHYINQEGDCAEELWIISRTADAPEGQRRVRLADGTQGELIALRAGGETPNYADPTGLGKTPCRAEDRSAPLVDLQEFQRKSDYVEEVKLWEEQLDGKTVVVFQVIYKGMNANLLGIPTDAEGKLEQIYYDVGTGNRVKFVIEIFYSGEEWQGETSTEEKYEYLERLPEDMEEEIEQSIEELQFFVDVLS